MTDEEFAKSIGATPVSSSSDDDFAKSLGAVPVDQEGLLLGNLRTMGGSFTALGDMALGIPKVGAQAALALTARGLAGITGKQATLNDTWKAAGEAMDESPYVPNLGKGFGVENNLGYQVVNYPFQKLGQGIDWSANKTEQGLTPVIGAQAAGDLSGQVSMIGNILGADLGLKAIHVSGKGIGKFLKKDEVPQVVAPPIPEVTAQDLGAVRLDNQSNMAGGAGAFDNIRRQTAGEIPASNDITNTPMERVTDTLLNGKDQAASVGAENAEGNSIVTNYWKERAAQIQAEEAGMRDANSRDSRDQATAPDQMAQRPMQVNGQGMVGDVPTMDALSRSTEGIHYEQVPPDGVIPRDSPVNGITVPRSVQERWSAPDENGIPVRNGLPQEPIDKLTQTINPNTQEVHDLGNAIQEANGPKLGPDEHYGVGQLDTISPAFNNIIRGPGKRQLGSSGMHEDLANLTVKAIRGAADLVKRSTSAFADMATKAVKSLIGMLPEEHMSNVSGQDMVYKPKSGEKSLQEALSQGQMNTKLWKNVQSGLALAAEKTGSVALKSVGEWLNWSDKRTHLDNRLTVDPVQGKIKKLPTQDFQSLHTLLMNEQNTGKRLDEATLAKTLTPKAVEAYKALRKAQDDAWNRNVSTSKAIGKDPGTREDAYHVSSRIGDYKYPVYNKSGKLVWFDSSLDRIHQLKFETWAKKNIKDIDWDKSKPFFGPDSSGPGIPRDIMATYQKMMSFFDPNDPTTTLIRDSINKYNDEHGFTNKGFNQRLLDKSNVPGFEGNKPWLSPKENAKSFMDAQVKYLRDSNHWNNLQEALGEMKPILSNEKLIRDQPNIMQVAAAHVSRELGITGNKLAAIEASWAKHFPKVGMVDGKPTIAMGISRGNVYKGVADVKTGTYLTMLGANVPYMITTPLQAVMAVAQHRALTLKGFDHNVMKTTINSLGDVAGGLAKHFMSSMTGKDVAIPMSDIGKRMLKYAEDNGIIDKTIMDETGGTRNHAILDPIKKTLGQTITAPEKIARFSTFISFAHHLMDGGKLSEADAFKIAEDFTNHSLTSMRRADKPLVVDKLGSAGQLGYVFKSYLFNEYNQLSQMAGLAKKGSVSPLLAHLGILFALGGALSLPGVNELDGAYDLWKNGVAAMRPQNYKPDIGIKGAILRDLPTWASIGTASSVTGSNLGTRFNTQVANITNPLSDVAVPIQEGREIMSIKDWIMDPTMRNALQAAHANSGSTIKGQMETHLDSYKNINKRTTNGRNPDGTQSYRRANDINDVSTDYKRTPEDETKRAIGMYSDQEYKTKQIRYSNNKEEERIKTAYDKMMKLAISAGVDGNAQRAQLFSQKALQLDPDPEKYTSKLNQAIVDLGATPEQRDKMKANRILELQKVLRATSH